MSGIKDSIASMFGGGGSSNIATLAAGIAPPTAIAPPKIPDPYAPEAMEAKRRALRNAAESGGRQSTMLTPAAPAMGAATYGARTLAGGA